jgi:hypothetical protein
MGFQGQHLMFYSITEVSIDARDLQAFLENF